MANTMIGSIATIIGLLAVPIPFFIFLDRNIKETKRKNIALNIFGLENETLNERVRLFHRFISNSLGRGVVKKILKMSIISVFSISFIFLAQFYFNEPDFDKTSIKFIESVFKFKLFSVLAIVSFIVIDVLSFFQTLAFMRLSTYCRNIFEVTYIFFADVVVSLFIVIIILPILLIFSFSLSEQSVQKTLRMGLSGSMTAQDISIQDLILGSAPKLESEESASLPRSSDGPSGWYMAAYDLYVPAAGGDFDLKSIANGPSRSVGRTVLFERGNLSAEAEADYLAKLFQQSENVDAVSVGSFYDGLFGDRIFLLNIVGKTSSEFNNIARLYAGILDDVNFFGNDISKLFNLRSKVYTENEITWAVAFMGSDSISESDVVYICDDKNASIVSKEEFGSLNDANCDQGLAVLSYYVSGLDTILSYNLDDELMITILPTALSSIALTAMIYISLIIWMILGLFPRFIKENFDNHSTVIANHIFTISYSIFSIFLLIFICIMTLTN